MKDTFKQASLYEKVMMVLGGISLTAMVGGYLYITFVLKLPLPGLTP